MIGQKNHATTTLPVGYLTSYDVQIGVAVFEVQYRWLLLRKLQFSSAQLSLRYEKTFVGKSQKGFDLLGHDITPKNFSPSQKIQEKALENAQEGQKSLVEYLNRWRTWVYAGLPFKVERVDDVVKSIVDAIVKGTSFNRTQEQSCDEKQRNRTSESLDASQVNRSIISVPDGDNNNLQDKECFMYKILVSALLLAISQSYAATTVVETYPLDSYSSQFISCASSLDYSEKLSEFSTTTYNNLPSVEDSNSSLLKTGKMADFLDSARLAISEYDSINFLGVRLIHKHNTLLDGEIMNEIYSDSEPTPTIITSNRMTMKKSVPASWLITSNGFEVFEYSTDIVPIGAFQYLSEHQQALDTIASIVKSFGYESYLAPSVIARDCFKDFDEDSRLLERSRSLRVVDREIHENVVTGVCSESYLKMDTIQTSWSIQPVGKEVGCYKVSGCLNEGGVHKRCSSHTEEQDRFDLSLALSGGKPRQLACARCTESYCVQGRDGHVSIERQYHENT
jgi:hypothetical protein